MVSKSLLYSLLKLHSIYSYEMKKIERWVRNKIIRKFIKKPKPVRFFRQKGKFLKKYPDYKVGDGTYGIPIVRDWNEGSTLEIGSYCSISWNVKIYLGGLHRTDWVSQYPFPAYWPPANDIKNYGGTKGDVLIGSDVWVCENAIILSGVSIGHGAVIANSAVVTKDVQPYEIVGGNPAKHIRYRFEKEIREKLLATKWWDWPVEEVLGISEMLCSQHITRLLEYAEQRKSN